MIKTARAVHPNQGTAARYRKQMLALVDEMHVSVIYWLKAAYREAPPVLAQDASPAKYMARKFRELGDRWLKRFDSSAPKIAEAYLKGSFKNTDSAMRMALKDAGWTVKFEMTPAMRDAFDASLTENVGLIRSIPAEYLQQVEGSVMRSFVAGRDLKSMVDDIKTLYPKAANRAVLIARDQNNKATATVTRARQLELGIKEAIWMHSNGGKHPRASHVKAGAERRRYDVSKGCLIDGEYIFPGELINCRCVSRSVLPF